MKGTLLGLRQLVSDIFGVGSDDVPKLGIFDSIALGALLAGDDGKT